MNRAIACAALAAAAGCGGKSQSPEPAEPAEPAEPSPTVEPEPTEPAAGDALVDQACDKMAAVHAQTPCDFLDRANFSARGCRAEMARSKVPEKLRPAFDEAMRCVVAADQCQGFPACFAAFQKTASAAGPDRECGEQGIGAVSLSADEAAKRYGQGVTRLSEVPTTKAQPIEVCGVGAQHQWLAAARCDDGSSPIQSADDARAARAGSMGVGGRCANVIDKYVVKCPDKTHEVFMDLYMCGPGEGI